MIKKVKPDAWYECFDIEVYDHGEKIYTGPKFIRCFYNECGEIVTQGMILERGCCYGCGGRKFRPAVKLNTYDKTRLLSGEVPFLPWESELLEGASND